MTFIYNADSGWINLFIDTFYKLFLPSRYPCSLCALTHGLVGEKAVWKQYREEFASQSVFLHRDEFEANFVERFTYPCIVQESQRGIHILVDAEQLQNLEHVDQLIQLLKALPENS